MDNFKIRKNYSYLIIILICIVVLFFSSFIKFINMPEVDKQEDKELVSTQSDNEPTKVSIIDYFTRIMPIQRVNIDLAEAKDSLFKLNAWIIISDKPIIQQIDKSGIDFIDNLSFRFGTFARINNNTNNVYILDGDNNILYKAEILSNTLINDETYTIDNIGLKIDNNKEYYIKIESLDADDENSIAIYTIPPNIKEHMKLIDENNNEEVKEESLFYVINNSIAADVLANALYGNNLLIEDNKSIRNSKILFCIVWLGLVTSFVLLMSYIIMYIRELGKK